MPSIYLGKQSGSYITTGAVWVDVKDETESKSLFKKYKHEPRSSHSKGNIYLCKGKYTWSNCATLQTGTDYKNSQLQYAEVYFNRFDKNSTALVCFLKFDTGKSRIYKHSEHGYFIDGHQNTPITSLTASNNGQNILDEVLKENDQLAEPLTFNIGRKKGDNNGDGNNGSTNQYNNKKIQIEDNTSSGEPNLESSGFKSYKHTPASGNGNESKKACVLYNYYLLIGEGKIPINSIQEQTYNYVCVYYSDKVSEPLLVEFNQKGFSSNTNSKYYYHTWEGNDDRSLYWKEITSGQKVLDVQLNSGSSDVYSQLTGTGNKKLIELLVALESHLQKTVVVLIDKKQGQYEQSDFKTSYADSKKYRLINKEIPVKDKTDSSECQCLDKTGFKVYEHDFTTSVKDVQEGKETVRLKFIITSSDTPSKYDEIILYKSESTISRDAEPLEYKPQNKNLYVYFYGEKDPRPLIICYGANTYKPKKQADPIQQRQVMVDYTKWIKVKEVKQCTCQNGDTSGQNQHILDALNEVTGFLNPVQINPTQIPSLARTTITAEPRTSPVKADYDLHTYLPDKTIKMGISRNTLTCYKSFQYQPYGLNGKGTSQRADSYRLGTVLHTKTSHSSTRSTLKYTSESNYKYYPVVSVTVYYYDKDSKYDDPLLIELEFKTNGVGGAGTGPKEYYKLTQAGGDSGADTLQWKKDDNAQGKMGTNHSAVEHLDKIRHSLKKVVKILIDQQNPYNLCLSSEPGGKNGGYSQNGGHTITVQACTEGECSKLKTAGYVCYVHKVSEINGVGPAFNYNQIGGLKFYISGNGTGGGGDQDIPIPLYSGGSSPVNPITYNTCMKDIYVYFYCKPGGDQGCKGPSNNPTAPLMLYYNKGYYRPDNIDNYFTKWVPETGLASVTAPCGSDNGTPPNYQTLVTKLNDVNRALNRICLTHQIGGLSSGGGSASSTYGISKPSGPPNDPNIVLERIQVTKIEGKDNRPYCKLVHRTMNGFSIGEIWYSTQDITKGGVKINNGGGGNITVDSSNHTEFLSTGTSNNTPNTVVAYYHTDDTTHTLPQLIVLLHTQGEIRDGADPIKATTGSKYGYYILATNGTGGTGGYKYEWRTVDPQPKPFELDDQTEFSLLNSVVILVDKQTEYNELTLNTALTNSKTIRSPGNDQGVNRLKNREINVKNETGEIAKCVSTYGYKLFEHGLTKATEQIHSINPILGLRFLIPSSTKAEGSYDEIKLHTDNKAQQDVGPMYHTSTQATVYMYFYDKDPRPLLLCYEKSAYIPKKTGEPTVDKQVNVDYTKWTRESTIKQCTCNGEGTDSPNTEILETLLKVVLFLNPVQINPTKLPTLATAVITAEFPKPPGKNSRDITYKLHQYKYSSHVKMKITRDDVGCYDKYSYEPNGTGGNGNGFRLGSVHYSPSTYSNKFNYLNYNTLTTQYKNHPLVKATVFYYDHDQSYSDPLLIELEFNTKGGAGVGTPAKPKEYYKLKSLIETDGTGMVWQLDPHGKDQIGESDTDNKNLINYLDKIRYQFKKVLQICIAIKQTKTYPAKLLNKENDKSVVPEDVIQVPVSEETNSGSISGTGFRCFKHKITELESDKLHKFAALRFVIPSRDTTELVKLNLYGPPRTGAIEPLYYNCSMGDIYVYFYGGNASGGGHQYDGDPRPLLLCYNRTAYRARSMTTYDFQIWFKAKKINNCVCEKNTDKNLLPALAHVSNFLNPVWIHETSGIYNVHSFNGQQISIKITETPGLQKFCYNKYTHIHNGTGSGGQGFRLGKIEYGISCIKEKNKLRSCINSLISQTPKFDPAREVIVYYYRGDANHQNPLLVVLCKTANGGVPNGLGNTCTYNPYYELQKPSKDPYETRLYKRIDMVIKLDEKTGSDLEKILDRILFSISKRLQILLGQRPDPIPLCPIERKRIKLPEPKTPFKDLDYPEIIHQLVNDTVIASTQMSQAITETILSSKNPKSYDYINRGTCQERKSEEFDPKIKTRTPSYPARVYNNTGKQEQGPNKTRNIKVQKIDCPDLSTKGYQCYRHLLTQIKDINNFGGLRLFLWDNRTSDDNDSQCKPSPPNPPSKPKCCELDLHGDETQTSGTCSTTKKIEPIAYTTCKGDLYVYFYGSDPRPMLLCYNGHSYAPTDLQTYSEKWCRVKEIQSCECDTSGFKPAQPLLDTLYKTSMFLNPVNLWETLEAHKKVKPEVTRIREAKKKGDPVPKIGKLPEHVYTVQTFGDTDINIKVKSADLNCYRQYTFESAMGDSGSSVRRDYRLGSIFYGYGSDQVSKRGADETCLSYPNHQRLQSVSLYYYMYDSDHRYPLIIQLDYGFGGELDDYYRVCQIGTGQGATSGSSNGAGSNGGTTTHASATPSAEEIAKKITWVKIKCPVTEGHGPGNVHSQDDSGQAQTSAGSAGSCSDDCPKPTGPDGTPLKEETVKELAENDSRFVKEAHQVQMKTRKLSLGEHPLFGQQYLDLVAELQALIEARCYDVRRKYGIKYEKGEKNENLIMVTDENCYEYHGSLKCFKNRVNVLNKLVYIENMNLEDWKRRPIQKREGDGQSEQKGCSMAL